MIATELEHLDPWFFDIEPHVEVMHQVVTAQLAARRAGSASTKSRAGVRGGGAKPWKQKGTGRARQGSTRAPHWSGGGVAHGPQVRSFKQRTPKKMVHLALRSALSDRSHAHRVAVIDQFPFRVPKTKDAVHLLARLGIDSTVLVVVDPNDDIAAKSFRNLPTAHVTTPRNLNAYDILRHDWILFERSTVPQRAMKLEDEATQQGAGDPGTEGTPVVPSHDIGNSTASGGSNVTTYTVGSERAAIARYGDEYIKFESYGDKISANWTTTRGPKVVAKLVRTNASFDLWSATAEEHASSAARFNEKVRKLADPIRAWAVEGGEDVVIAWRVIPITADLGEPQYHRTLFQVGLLLPRSAARRLEQAVGETASKKVRANLAAVLADEAVKAVLATRVDSDQER